MKMTGQPNKAVIAIHEVMTKVSNVHKSSSQNLNYDFVSKDTVIAALRSHMIENGLVVYPVEINDVQQVQIQAANSKIAYRATGTVVFRFQHAPSGDYIDVPISSEAIDYSDKATNKLLGFAIKNVLLQTFMLESGEKDPEEQTGESSAVEPQKSANQARMDNQWEREIINKAVELQLVDDEYNAVGILNASPFMSISYGKLETKVGLAYLIAHKTVKEKAPDADTESRKTATRNLWERDKDKLIARAVEYLGG
jgi:hypothetical protein